MEKEKPTNVVAIPIILIALADIVENLRLNRNSREISLAITKLQEAIFWLRAGINGE